MGSEDEATKKKKPVSKKQEKRRRKGKGKGRRGVGQTTLQGGRAIFNVMKKGGAQGTTNSLKEEGTGKEQEERGGLHPTEKRGTETKIESENIWPCESPPEDAKTKRTHGGQKGGEEEPHEEHRGGNTGQVRKGNKKRLNFGTK